jgi:hypothetical protein
VREKQNSVKERESDLGKVSPEKGLLSDERVMALLQDPTVVQALSSAYVFTLGVFMFLVYGLICRSHQTILRTCELKPEKLGGMHVFSPIHCSCVVQFLLRFPARYVMTCMNYP